MMVMTVGNACEDSNTYRAVNSDLMVLGATRTVAIAGIDTVKNGKHLIKVDAKEPIQSRLIVCQMSTCLVRKLP